MYDYSDLVDYPIKDTGVEIDEVFDTSSDDVPPERAEIEKWLIEMKPYVDAGKRVYWIFNHGKHPVNQTGWNDVNIPNHTLQTLAQVANDKLKGKEKDKNGNLLKITGFGIVQGKFFDKPAEYTFDFDNPEFYEKFLAECDKKNINLSELPAVKSGRGRHLIFCTKDQLEYDDHKLAWYYKESEKTIGIELRGNNQFIVRPPSLHHSGSAYSIISGEPWNPPVISPELAQELLEIAIGLDETRKDEEPKIEIKTEENNWTDLNLPEGKPEYIRFYAYFCKNHFDISEDAGFRQFMMACGFEIKGEGVHEGYDCYYIKSPNVDRYSGEEAKKDISVSPFKKRFVCHAFHASDANFECRSLQEWCEKFYPTAITGFNETQEKRGNFKPSKILDPKDIEEVKVDDKEISLKRLINDRNPVRFILNLDKLNIPVKFLDAFNEMKDITGRDTTSFGILSLILNICVGKTVKFTTLPGKTYYTTLRIADLDYPGTSKSAAMDSLLGIARQNVYINQNLDTQQSTTSQAFLKTFLTKVPDVPTGKDFEKLTESEKMDIRSRKWIRDRKNQIREAQYAYREPTGICVDDGMAFINSMTTESNGAYKTISSWCSILDDTPELRYMTVGGGEYILYDACMPLYINTVVDQFQAFANNNNVRNSGGAIRLLPLNAQAIEFKSDMAVRWGSYERLIKEVLDATSEKTPGHEKEIVIKLPYDSPSDRKKGAGKEGEILDQMANSNDLFKNYFGGLTPNDRPMTVKAIVQAKKLASIFCVLDNLKEISEKDKITLDGEKYLYGALVIVMTSHITNDMFYSGGEEKEEMNKVLKYIQKTYVEFSQDKDKKKTKTKKKLTTAGITINTRLCTGAYSTKFKKVEEILRMLKSAGMVEMAKFGRSEIWEPMQDAKPSDKNEQKAQK